MDRTKQNEIDLEVLQSQSSFSNITDSQIFQSKPSENHSVVRPEVLKFTKDARLELAIREMRIGQRVHEELKQQGRTVTWLAKQLGMERTNLYYTFKRDSISMELLLRISCLLNHDFFQDIFDVCKTYGLF